MQQQPVVPETRHFLEPLLTVEEIALHLCCQRILTSDQVAGSQCQTDFDVADAVEDVFLY
jgi:hypothetical protein